MNAFAHFYCSHPLIVITVIGSQITDVLTESETESTLFYSGTIEHNKECGHSNNSTGNSRAAAAIATEKADCSA